MARAVARGEDVNAKTIGRDLLRNTLMAGAQAAGGSGKNGIADGSGNGKAGTGGTPNNIKPDPDVAGSRSVFKTGGKGVSGAKTDFYVKPSGEAVPATGYRYMDSSATYLNDLAKNKVIPANRNGTYISFDNYTKPNSGALQVPHDASYKASFDTLQVIDDLRVPNGKWGKADYLEPITNDFPKYGQGGATQAITNKPIKIDELVNLNK